MKAVWCLLLLILAIALEATPARRKRPENPRHLNKDEGADIVYTKEQLESIKDSGRSKRSTATMPLWPDSNVVYEFADMESDLESLVLQAIDKWSEATCLVFEEFDGIDADQPRIKFYRSESSCQSNLGYTSGIQGIWLSNRHCSYIGVLLHEIGHAIGLVHEHTRSDRNDYVTIHFDNIVSGLENNFKLSTYVTDTTVPYNLGSIMHYGPYSFSVVPNNDAYVTIEPYDSALQNVMGRQEKLSHLDILYVNKLYSCNAGCTDAQLAQNCKNGGFVGKDCTCVCPDGIVGDLCQSVAPSKTSSDCGGHFTEDNGAITSPDYPENYPLNTQCYYLIEAPEGARVSLTFETFNVEEDAFCFWDQLHIRYHGAHFDTLAPPYCGTSLEGMTIYSTGNVIMLDFISDDFWTEQGFRAKYNFIDDDECDLQTHECDANAQCENTIGSYSCICNEGYGGDGFECTANTGCDQTNDCDANAECANTDGSYDCTCNNGYEGDGLECTDINECDQTNDCDANAECANNDGSYDCTCNNGYEGDGLVCTEPSTPNQLSIAAIGGCSSTPEEVYGRITSENYPGGYNPYSSCTWTIDIPAGTFVYLWFERIDVDLFDGECYDTVEITSGSTTKVFCGQTLPDDLSFTEDVVVEFTTDNVYEWTGFALNYVVLESEADDWNEWSEWSECTATCGTGSISRTRSCSDSYCIGLDLQETSCGDLSPCENRCEPEMTHTQNSNGGRIKSPGYPFQYPKKYYIKRKVYCNVTIDVPADKSVTFSFNDLDFTCCDYDCIFDRLVFIHNNKKTKVCRNDVSTTLEYGSGTVMVIFRTVNRDYEGIYSRGFDMLYTFT